MKITICIGSSCHLKGSRQIVEERRVLRKADHRRFQHSGRLGMAAQRRQRARVAGHEHIAFGMVAGEGLERRQ